MRQTDPSVSATVGPAPSSPCSELEKPTSSAVTGAYASADGPSLGAPYPGNNPPDWHKFVNICQSGSDLLFDNPLGDQTPQTGQSPCSNFGTGGFLSNTDNAYVYAFLSRGFGPIVVFHGRAPSFANTYPDAQLRAVRDGPLLPRVLRRLAGRRQGVLLTAADVPLAG